MKKTFEEAIKLITTSEYEKASKEGKVTMIREYMSDFFAEEYAEDAAVIRYTLKELVIDEPTSLFFGCPLRILLYVEYHRDNREKSFLQNMISYFLDINMPIQEREEVLQDMITLETSLGVALTDKKIPVEDVIQMIYLFKRILRGEIKDANIDDIMRRQ